MSEPNNKPQIIITLENAEEARLSITGVMPNLTVAINMLKQALRETELKDSEQRQQARMESAFKNLQLSAALRGGKV